jgi:hypothetical protein
VNTSQQPPLFIFVHLAKTGGMSLHKHLEHNVSASQQLLITPTVLGVGSKSVVDIKQANIELVKKNKSLFRRRRNPLLHIQGHMVNPELAKAIQAQLKQPRQIYHYTFLRDPVKRILSVYNYYSQWYWNDPPDQRAKQLYQLILLVDGKYPDFETWYFKKFKKDKRYLGMNNNIEYFHRAGFLSSKTSLKSMRECLANFDFIGFTETFTADSNYLYFTWGFNKFFLNQNISQRHYQLQENSPLYQAIRKDLAPAYRFYDLAKEVKADWLKTHPEYNQINHRMQGPRALTPVTQLLYDWPNNARMLSSYLRQAIPGYAWIKDMVS